MVGDRDDWGLCRVALWEQDATRIGLYCDFYPDMVRFSVQFITIPCNFFSYRETVKWMRPNFAM